MAFQYFLYNTLYNNTLVERSNNSFAPLPPNTGEIYSDFFIPEIQPLYYYRESGSTIILNDEETINEYLQGTVPPPTPDTNVTYGEFTGTTAILSATTSGLQMNKVNVSGDTMTGTLHTTNDFTAVGMVSGSTVCGGVWVNSPFICGQTKIQSPIITGGTCVTSPITCGTTRVQSPVVCGSTCSIAPIIIGSTCVCSPIVCASSCVRSPIVSGSTAVCGAIVCGVTCVTSSLSCATTRMQSPIVCGSTCVTSPITCGTTCVISPIVFGSTCVCSPTVCSSTCLCSTGTARFTGAVTAASTLNVSGNTTLSATARSVTPTTTDRSTCIATTAYVRNYLETLTGGSSTYLYTEKTTKQTTTSASCIMYLSGTPWNFVAGRYTLDYSVFFGNAGTNGCTFVKFGVDDVAQGVNMMMRMTSTAATLAATISRDVTLTAGCHCLTVHFWQGSGTACVDFASIRARRIS